MKILVTGGSGFIGSHICDAFSEAKHSVSILDIKKSKWINTKQKMIVGDINNTKILDSATKNMDAVIHCAGLADLNISFSKPQDSVQNNILASVKLIDSCIKNKVKKIIYASTVYVFSKEGSFYRCSKRAVEDYLEEYASQKKIKYTILRFGSIYGPRSDNTNGLYNLIFNLIKHKKIILDKNQNTIREYIHVHDVARACLEILNNKYNNKCITLTGSEKVRFKELIDMVSEISSIKKIKKINKRNIGHYDSTPYSYLPKIGLKYNLKENYDIGMGLLELIDVVQREINDKKK